MIRRHSGFTLIEVLTALGVSALVLSIAVPALGSFTSNAQQTGTINEFVASMHLARNTAITSNSRVAICASESGIACDADAWDSGWIVFTDSDRDRVVDIDEPIIGTAAAADGLSMRSPVFGRAFAFRPNGRAMTDSPGGTSGEFVVCDDRGSRHAKTVIIDRSGRPRASDRLADGGAPSCG